jgi:proline dehydrogenase
LARFSAVRSQEYFSARSRFSDAANGTAYILWHGKEDPHLSEWPQERGQLGEKEGRGRMSLMRSLLLAASQNQWLRDRATRHRFVRNTVSRFMPGERLNDALAAAQILRTKKISTVLTHLGENIKDHAEARQVTEHYLEVLERLEQERLRAEVSVKLTQLGLDLSPEVCFENLKAIIGRARRDSTVWVDMEASNYVDVTLKLYRRVLQVYPNVGVCLQAYLYRTKDDLTKLLPLRPSIRLVKGAYNEPPEIAFPRKKDVDKNYFELAKQLLRGRKENRCLRAAFGTHDVALIRRLSGFAHSEGLSMADLEVQMLYGIQRAEQERLANEGHTSIVLVAYGSYWYPWFVRRLAERPANLWFMARNLFVG